MSSLKGFLEKDVIEPPEKAYAVLSKDFLAYRYKNLTLLAISLVFAFWLSTFKPFNDFLLTLGNYSYVGAFLGGFFFVSTFTVATGGLALFILAREMNPVALVILAGFGALLSNLLVFRFIKDGVEVEVERLYKNFGGNHLNHLLHSRHFRWSLPVIGALIILSPLPDDLGVSLMGISKMKTSQFALFSLVLNVIGLIILVIIAKYFKF